MHHLPTENFQETIRAFPTEIMQQSQEDYFRAFRSSLHLAYDFEPRARCSATVGARSEFPTNF